MKVSQEIKKELGGAVSSAEEQKFSNFILKYNEYLDYVDKLNIYSNNIHYSLEYRKPYF